MRTEQKIFIGVCECNGVVQAEVNEHGVIRGFNGFNLVLPDQSADNETYLDMHSWFHCLDMGFNFNTRSGATVFFQSGDYFIDPIDADYPEKLTDEQAEQIEQAYETEGSYCSRCGLFHDTQEQSMEPDFIIDYEACEVYCKQCAETADYLKPLNDETDLFRSKDITGMDSPEGFTEIETLFCDSSGFGSANEPALTKEQAEQAVLDLIDQYPGETLYSAITGIGQFQVYVSIYRIDNE